MFIGPSIARPFDLWSSGTSKRVSAFAPKRTQIPDPTLVFFFLNSSSFHQLQYLIVPSSKDQATAESFASDSFDFYILEQPRPKETDCGSLFCSLRIRPSRILLIYDISG